MLKNGQSNMNNLECEVCKEPLTLLEVEYDVFNRPVCSNCYEELTDPNEWKLEDDNW